MTIELVIPRLGESIQEVEIGRWLKREGDRVREDETLVEIETDKASVDLPAPAEGILAKILKQTGQSVSIGETIAMLEEDGKAEGRPEEKGQDRSEQRASPQDRPVKKDAEAKPSDGKEAGERDRRAAPQDRQVKKEAGEKPTDGKETGKPEQQQEQPIQTPRQAADQKPKPAKPPHEPAESQIATTPSARRALREHGLRPGEVRHTGERLRREDVERHVAEHPREESAIEQGGAPRPAEAAREEAVPMSLLRRRIAERLVAAQQRAALVSTFNEIDMSAVKDLRERRGEDFQKRYGVKLGFMSFFVKAAIEALKEVPEINAEIRGTDIVYHKDYHIGIAVATDRGLVVPVLKNAERMSFAEIERAIDDFARRAREHSLKPDGLAGGTFSISNGGIYGSLLSTPIVNPPQSGVLGLHAIQDRPVAREGQVVIRPMMYVALTYDHRLIDGREAVTFLRRIREIVEEPARMLIEV